MTSRRQLEEKWDKLRRVPVAGKPTVIFDRQRRIHLLFELFLAGLILLFFAALIAGVR